MEIYYDYYYYYSLSTKEKEKKKLKKRKEKKKKTKKTRWSTRASVDGVWIAAGSPPALSECMMLLSVTR